MGRPRTKTARERQSVPHKRDRCRHGSFEKFGPAGDRRVHRHRRGEDIGGGYRLEVSSRDCSARPS